MCFEILKTFNETDCKHAIIKTAKGNCNCFYCLTFSGTRDIILAFILSAGPKAFRLFFNKLACFVNATLFYVSENFYSANALSISKLFNKTLKIFHKNTRFPAYMGAIAKLKASLKQNRHFKTKLQRLKVNFLAPQGRSCDYKTTSFTNWLCRYIFEFFCSKCRTELLE